MNGSRGGGGRGDPDSQENSSFLNLYNKITKNMPLTLPPPLQSL